MVVPQKARKEVLDLIHQAHLGRERTYYCCKSRYYWPGLKEAVDALVSRCPSCIEWGAPRNPEALLNQQLPRAPMEKVSIDIFDFGGVSNLLTVDRYSGYIWVTEFRRAPSSAAIIAALSDIFRTFGFPTAIRADGASYFTSEEFQTWARRVEITVETSSAYHSESNGFCERHVALAKALIRKTHSAKGNLREALAMWLATPRTADGLSPTRILMGREARIPGLLTVRDGKDSDLAARNAQERKEQLQDEVNKKRSLNWSPLALEPGMRILMKCQNSGAFTIPGKIISVRPGGRSAYVEGSGGRTFLRNRRYLAPDPEYLPPADECSFVKVVMSKTEAKKPILRSRGAPPQKPGLRVQFEADLVLDREREAGSKSSSTAQGWQDTCHVGAGA